MFTPGKLVNTPCFSPRKGLIFISTSFWSLPGIKANAVLTRWLSSVGEESIMNYMHLGTWTWPWRKSSQSAHGSSQSWQSKDCAGVQHDQVEFGIVCSSSLLIFRAWYHHDRGTAVIITCFPMCWVTRVSESGNTITEFQTLALPKNIWGREFRHIWALNKSIFFGPSLWSGPKAEQKSQGIRNPQPRQALGRRCEHSRLWARAWSTVFVIHRVHTWQNDPNNYPWWKPAYFT